MNDRFSKYGLTKKDVAIILGKTKLIGYGVWLGMLPVCYRYRPLRRFFKRPWPKIALQKVQTTWPNVYQKGQQFIANGADKLSKWKYFKPIPKQLGLKSKKFTLAIAENIVLFKLTIPVQVGIVAGHHIYTHREDRKDRKDREDRKDMMEESIQKLENVNVLDAIEDSFEMHNESKNVNLYDALSVVHDEIHGIF